MAGLHKSEIQNPVINWIDTRMPIFTMIQKEYGSFPTPKNFNYFWNFGALAMVNLVIMIATGVFLAMNYTPNTSMAFDSVERIMRDVNYGWLLRYVHANGASMFFIVTYIHIFRAMYYGSYKKPRELLFMLGVLILLLMMATAFMGYVLPWGQMSYWGATVITNLFSAIPLVGESIVTLLWGGFSVDNPTLNRFFSLHYLFPFMITGVVFLHIVALHITGSNNPLGIDVKSPQDTLPFHPYYTTKDSVGICVYLLVFAVLVFFAPNFLNHPDNYIPANPLVTPAHIVPEWYFLPVLRHPPLRPEQARRRADDVRLHRHPVRAALARHVAGPQLTLPADLPATDVRAGRFAVRPARLSCGGKPPEGIYVVIGRVVHRVLLPALPGFAARCSASSRRPLPLPDSISTPSRSNVSRNGPARRRRTFAGSGAAAKPMEKP